MKTAFLLICLLLAGCATQQQKEAYAIQKYGPTCERLGLSGDQEIRCIASLYKNNEGNFWHGLGSGLRAAGGTISPQVYANQNGYSYQQPNYMQSTHCSPDYMGGFTCTQH